MTRYKSNPLEVCNEKGAILLKAVLKVDEHSSYFNHNDNELGYDYPYHHEIELHYADGLIETYESVTREYYITPIDWTILLNIEGGPLGSNHTKKIKTTDGIEFVLTSVCFNMEAILVREARKLFGIPNGKFTKDEE